MSHRYSREEKGKGISTANRWVRDRPVLLPAVENTDLIEANRLTLIGRVINPEIQKPKSVINFLPHLWNLQHPVAGRELGRERFSFTFQSEEDLLWVLNKAPFHYKRWMLVIQRWEPVISDNFPNVIPFWITIHDLPLHYWKFATLKAIDDDEIEKAVYDIHSARAPGPDGFSSGFFHTYWPIVKDDISREVRLFFTTGHFPRQQNVTHIRLIPKVLNPRKITEYRPIALCNVFYKVIAKILTQRLHNVLPHLISENQSAFVPGRAISDNVLITHEVLHVLRRSKARFRGAMAVKTDMSKAYDRVEWSFLLAVLLRLGFHARWVGWIMECVSSVSYSFLVNGSPQGRVVPTRGLRQGDPLSPYLFILCTEVLSGLCRNAQTSGSLVGVKAGIHSPPVNHLLFADDTMFFCQANESSCLALRTILDSYERASGQTINLQKSSVIFAAKTVRGKRTKIKQLLRIHKEGGTGKYLGLPEDFGRRKQDIFSSIDDRIRQKSHSWSTRFLSQAGKHVMLQSVLAAMPTHAMSCFKIPRSLCKRIQSVFTRFWWDAKPDVRKMCWVAWDKLTRPKAIGGLGFRDVESFNDALLAKLSWRLLKNPTSLAARVLLGKYCHDSPFMTCNLSKTASHGWKGILIGREVLKKGMGWLVGSGTDISVWSDAWLSLNEPLRPYGPPTEQNQHLRVSDFILPNTREWNWSQIHRHLPSAEPQIRLLRLSSHVRQDSLTWLYSKSGVYSVKTGYNLLQSEACTSLNAEFNWYRNVWRVQTEPKIRSFLWRAMSGALPTGDRLLTRGITGPRLCRHCNQQETVDHVLLLCPFAQIVWDLAPITITSFPSTPTVSLFLQLARDSVPLPPLGVSLAHLYAWISWNLWTARNRLVFENRQCSAADIITLAVNQAKAWELAQEHKTPLQRSHVRDASTPSVQHNQYSGISCFVDASWKSSSRICGLGICFRDNTDAVIYQTGVSRRFVSSALLAEALAVLEAIVIANSRGIQELHIYSDSQCLIRLLNSHEDNIDLSSVLHDVRSMANTFVSLSFSFISRQSNALADSIAKHALSDLDTLISIS